MTCELRGAGAVFAVAFEYRGEGLVIQVEAAPYAGKYETGAVAPAVPHLAFLDGLRALAAVYVVFQHTLQNGLPNATPAWLAFMGWGHNAVTLFIVISGFCLALPVLRSGHRLKGGALHFYKRRAIRILPPYYAAIALGIAVNVLTGAPGHHLATLHNPLFGKALLLHLLLVHNWFPSVAYAFDGPLWSIAVECQIYLCFPLLVYCWRKFGSLWLVGGTFVVAHTIFRLTGHNGSVNYLFEFVLGAWGAELAMRRQHLLQLRWVFFASVLTFLLLPSKNSVTADLFVGAGAASLMALCASGSFWLRPAFSFGPLAWLGSFSYSIYLVHGILIIGYLDYAHSHGGVAAGFPSPGYPLLAVLGLVIAPAVLIASYLFHLAFERPFMSVHKVKVAVTLPGAATATPD